MNSLRAKFRRKLFTLASSLLVAVLLLIATGEAHAARTILGKVTYELDDSPAVDVLVQAWDSDVGSDDFMGDALTDGAGNYRITYEGGHWDPAPHRVTTWRPDIYLKVYVRSNGTWLLVHTSDKKNNHKLRDDLTMNLAIRAPAVVRGHIVDQDGSPVAGVVVNAYDSDPTSSDDHMGWSITNAQGEYRIEYERRHWDTAPHASGLWRPDIYVSLSKSGFRVNPNSSPTHSNHELREDAVIDVQAQFTLDTVVVRGHITYEDADPEPNMTYSGQTEKPVRFASLTIRRIGTDELVRGRTDSQGNFAIIVKRHPNREYKLLLRPRNYAAQVYRDLDACNEEVWWRAGFTMPANGDIQLGGLRVGISSNTGLRGFWREVEGNWFHDIFCGGARHDLNGGAGYLNIAETILVAREYADANRDDSDSISQVAVTYPDNTYPDIPWTNPFFGEIYLTKSDSDTDDRDNAFMDVTIIHEYAHHLADDISENDWALTEHWYCTEAGTEQAWFEGFADYFGSFLLNRHRDDDRALAQYWADYETAENPFDECDPLSKEMELSTLAILWDIADGYDVDPATAAYPSSVNEDHDRIDYQDALIFQIFDRELDNLYDAPDMCQFVKAWQNRVSASMASRLELILSTYNAECD